MKQFLPGYVCLSLTLCLSQAAVHAQTTATKSASTVASTGSVANLAWGSPGNAKAKDGNYTVAVALLSATTVNTQTLQASGYGFAIPTAATISGITTTITRGGGSALSLTIGSGGSVQDNTVQLTSAPGGVTTLSLNKASSTTWGSPATDAVYGSATDTWGVPWTITQLNDATFGVNLVASITSGGTLSLLPAAYVDAVSVAVTYTTATTLPIDLTQWTVVRQGNANVLSWQASETGKVGGQFIVERSSDGVKWSDLATVNANADASAAFGYTDAAPFAVGPTYYRLRLHTAGESDSWSTVQVISTASAHPVLSVYPNPVVDGINISSATAFSKVSLHSVSGHTLYVKEYSGGVHSAQISASSLPAGVYFVRVDGVSYKVIKK